MNFKLLVLIVIFILSCTNSKKENKLQSINDSLTRENTILKSKFTIDSLQKELSKARDIPKKKTAYLEKNWKRISPKINTDFGNVYIQENINKKISYGFEHPMYFYTIETGSEAENDAQIAGIKRIVIEDEEGINEIKLNFKDHSEQTGFKCCLHNIEFDLKENIYYKAGQTLYKYNLRTNQNSRFKYNIINKDLQFIRDPEVFKTIKYGKYKGMIYMVFMANHFERGWTYIFAIVDSNGKHIYSTFDPKVLSEYEK